MARIDSTRRHGPFDPRFRGRRVRVVLGRPRATTEDHSEFARRRERLAATAAWEGEGGAL